MIDILVCFQILHGICINLLNMTALLLASHILCILENMRPGTFAKVITRVKVYLFIKLRTHKACYINFQFSY